MADLQLLRPYWLLALFPLAVIWLRYRRSGLQGQGIRKVIDPHLVDQMVVGSTVKSIVSPNNMLLILLLLTVFGLSGPTFQREVSPFAGDDAGLMVLLKLGSSMNSKDLQPSRLERAKQKLRDLLELRKGKSTGLIVYSGSSHLVMPLTSDASVIVTMIEDLTPDLMPKDGDDLARAMALGQRMIKQSGEVGSLLIMADSVSAAQITALSEATEKMTTLPVQILSINAIGTTVEPSLEKAGKLFDARLVEVSLDTADVENIARSAVTSLSQVGEHETGERWCDEGYWFLPFIAGIFLLWFRKGWVIR